jgi:hypothetical protein
MLFFTNHWTSINLGHNWIVNCYDLLWFQKFKGWKLRKPDWSKTNLHSTYKTNNIHPSQILCETCTGGCFKDLFVVSLAFSMFSIILGLCTKAKLLNEFSFWLFCNNKHNQLIYLYLQFSLRFCFNQSKI